MAEPNTLLIRARFNAGLSQEALAANAGIAPLTLRRLEKDKGLRPHATTAKALADAITGALNDGVVYRPTDLFPLDDLDDASQETPDAAA